MKAQAQIETAGALLVNAQGWVLMALRAPDKQAFPGHWDCVGGRLEAGETPEDAMIREIEEEIGVTPTVFAPLEAVFIPASGPFPACQCHMFVVRAWTGGEPRLASDENVELRWCSPEEIAALNPVVPVEYQELARRALEGTNR